MVPLSELLNRVRVRYEAESGGSAVRFTDAELSQIVNEGLETLAEETLFYERYATIPIMEAQTYYDLRGFTPEVPVEVKSIWSTVRNDWLTPLDENDLDNRWEQATGDPLAFFTRGIYWIGVYPRPAATTGFLRVHFAGLPSRFAHTASVLGDLPSDHLPALEDYALYEMAALDRTTKKALLQWSDYTKREKLLRDFVDRRLVHSRAGRFGGVRRLVGGGQVSGDGL